MLTDETHFAGSRPTSRRCAAAVDVPLLRKDFTVSENDVLDAAEMGASAVLLIVAVLERRRARARSSTLAHGVGLDAARRGARRRRGEASRWTAVRGSSASTNATCAPSRSIREHADAVIASLPTTIVTVAESGLRTRDDVAARGATRASTPCSWARRSSTAPSRDGRGADASHRCRWCDA